MVYAERSSDGQKLNEALNIVEGFLLRLKADNQLLGTSIERWRWNEPSITLAWSKEIVEHNIHAHIVDKEFMGLQIEVNSWLDEDREEGKVRVRHWKHQVISERIGLNEMEYGLFQKAFKIVSMWSQRMLKDKGEKAFLPVRQGAVR